MLATSSPATNRSEWKSVDGPSYRRVKCFEVELFVISTIEYFSSDIVFLFYGENEKRTCRCQLSL